MTKTKKSNGKYKVVVKPEKKLVKDLNLDEIHFTVGGDITYAGIMQYIRKKYDMKLKKDMGLFFFVNDKYIPRMSASIMEDFNSFKNENNEIVITLITENVFG